MKTPSATLSLCDACQITQQQCCHRQTSATPAVQMLVAPQHRPTRSAAASNLCLVPVAVCYAVLLCQAWSPDSLSLILPGSIQDGLSGRAQGLGFRV